MKIYNSISQPYELKNSSNSSEADATRVNLIYKSPKKDAPEAIKATADEILK